MYVDASIAAWRKIDLRQRAFRNSLFRAKFHASEEFCVRFIQTMVFVYLEDIVLAIGKEWDRGSLIFLLTPIFKIPSASRACNPAE